MNFLLQLPLEFRLAALFVLGAVVGGQLNRGIYRLAWRRRRIGPWSPAHDDAPQRHWLDRLPIVGWLLLRREVLLHGRGFWLRPLFIELLTGVGFAALYAWEIGGGLIADRPALAAADLGMLHAQYLSHIVLISLMVVATFIDFDEKTIPDEITVPGTLAALALAALLPAARLPILVPSELPLLGLPPVIDNLRLTTPHDWPAWLNQPRGLLLALACLLAWCLALMPTLWTTRGGLALGLQRLAASVLVRRRSRGYQLIAVLGSLAVAAFWWRGGAGWQSLLSSLVGLAFGGGLIWAVRIIGSRALGREAMGFGDVTLMAMIGAFLGWQPALLVFFLAPFAALAIAVTQMLITRKSDIAFGPYLCLATLVLIVFWGPIWNVHAGDVFRLGWFIPAMVAICLVLMGLMLWVWALAKDWLSRGRSPSRRRNKSKGRQRSGKKSKKGGKKNNR